MELLCLRFRAFNFEKNYISWLNPQSINERMDSLMKELFHKCRRSGKKKITAEGQIHLRYEFQIVCYSIQILKVGI